MKIAVVGTSGYIGCELSTYLTAKGQDVVRIGRSGEVDIHLDLRQADTFNYVQLEGIDYVVFSAAISGPDKCATAFEECWEVNVTGTGYFIEEALRRGCGVVFFSSDAVYASNPGEIYDEDSVMDPQTPYGRMKQAIEDQFCGRSSFKSVRLSYVVSYGDKFMLYLRGCREKHREAEIFHPFYRNAVMLNEVLISVNWLLENWNEYEPSVLCLAGDELISRLRIIDELNEIKGMYTEYRMVIPDMAFFRNRPPITQMRSQYLYSRGVLPRKAFTERFRQQITGEDK